MTDFRRFIRDVPDFPSPGILFRDVTPLLASPDAFGAAVRAMAEPFRGARPDKVLGIEARGFLFGTALARELNVGIVPARKSGKLPRATESVSYGLEYGKDSLEIHADSFTRGERVLVVDDVLATGGTAAAAAELAEKVGASVVGVSVFIELEALGGRSRLGARTAHAVLML
ncbi:MAG TPA: adenine phosphoribosyltransferase [Thermoanaerobaculia bacterium]|nr:adenine phosphoribosyltransferase [Thermoanaerobaculia bacterium]